MNRGRSGPGKILLVYLLAGTMSLTLPGFALARGGGGMAVGNGSFSHYGAGSFGAGQQGMRGSGAGWNGSSKAQSGDLLQNRDRFRDHLRSQDRILQGDQIRQRDRHQQRGQIQAPGN